MSNIYFGHFLSKAKNIDYLMSNAFERFVEKTVIMFLGISSKVNFVQKHPIDCPSTDGETVWYDPCPDIYVKKGLKLELIVYCIFGDIFHECLHVLYSYFPIVSMVKVGTYKKEKVSPKYQHLLNKVGEYMNQFSMSERAQIGDLLNIVEDSSIEYRGKQRNLFIEKCLTTSNAITFSQTPSISTLIEKGASNYDLLRLAIMDYAIIGSVKGRLPEELRELFRTQLIPLLKEGRKTQDTFESFECVKKIWVLISPYYTRKKEEEKQNSSNGENGNGQGSTDSTSNGTGSGKSNSNTTQKDNDTCVPYPKSSEMSHSTNPTNSKLNGFGSGLQVSSKTKEKAEKEYNAYMNGEPIEETPQETSKESNSIGSENGDEWESSEESFGVGEKELEDNIKAIQNSLKGVDKEFNLEQQQNECAKQEEFESRQMCRKLDYPDSLHIGANISLTVSYGKKDKLEYNKMVRENQNLINIFVKTFKTIFHNRQDRKVITDKGKLAKEKLYKAKFSQMTYKKLEKAKQPDDLAIVLLIDKSGSCGGERLDNAKLASVVMCEVCEKLNIPLAIVAHNASYPSFNIEFFKRFEGKYDKYSIPSMSCGNCNRDGLALLYVSEMLKKRPEKQKLIISITDGQPSDRGYSGEPAKADMLKIGDLLKKKGISLIGVAISGYKEGNDAIAKCYRNTISILDITTLPRELLRVLKPLL